MKLFDRKSPGFTLIELLIVVAIIGVLSTIAVPTFRGMIRKARMAESKLALGAIYSVESGFFAEHSVYGSNLAVMGFSMEAPKYYVSGFFMPDCREGTTDHMSPRFDPTSPPFVGKNCPQCTSGPKVFAQFPTYYTDAAKLGPGGQTFTTRIVPLRGDGTPTVPHVFVCNLQNHGVANDDYRPGFFDPGTFGPPGYLNYGDSGGWVPNPTGFRAGSFGVVAQGKTIESIDADQYIDAWIIDDSRRLQHLWDR